MPTVTPPYAPASSAAAAWPAEAPSLLPLVRRALHGAEGRVALRLVPAGPRLRRAARLLLQDSARAGGGRLLETAAGELLLLGATEASAERARAGLADAAGTAPGATLWRLPEESGPLLAWAEGAPPAARGERQDIARLEAALDALPLDRGVVVRRSVLRLGPDTAAGRAAHRLAVSRTALAEALGPLLPAGGDAELLDLAAGRIAGRLLRSPVPWPAPPSGGLVLLPLAEAGAPTPPPPPGAIGVLPLAAAAAPAALAARRDRLAAAGWSGLGFDGLDAALLSLIDPGALPPGPLLLRWSPALTDRAALAALRALDPARLILTGCDGAETLAWGLGAGLRHFAGPTLEALLATAAGGGAPHPAAPPPAAPAA